MARGEGELCLLTPSNDKIIIWNLEMTEREREGWTGGQYEINTSWKGWPLVVCRMWATVLWYKLLSRHFCFTLYQLFSICPKWVWKASPLKHTHVKLHYAAGWAALWQERGRTAHTPLRHLHIYLHFPLSWFHFQEIHNQMPCSNMRQHRSLSFQYLQWSLIKNLRWEAKFIVVSIHPEIDCTITDNFYQSGKNYVVLKSVKIHSHSVSLGLGS